MSWNLPPQVVPFAAFLAERLELGRVTVLGEDLPSFDDVGRVPVFTVDARRAEIPDPDSLPVFVAPWNPDMSPSATGRALLTMDDLHPLALVVAPPTEEPTTDCEGDLRNWLDLFGLAAPLLGALQPEEGSSTGALALVERRDSPLSPVVQVPDDFTVVALMLTYNEIDIVARSIDELRRQGVGVYVIDNWSTDGTYEVAMSLLGHGVVGIERTPIDAPPDHYDLEAILVRVEELGSEIEADWFTKNDTDEVRRGPWEGVSLREAVYRVDVAGYNRIDFTVVNFPPIDNEFEPGSDFVAYFRRFDWGHNPGHFVQQKAWKSFGQEVSLAAQAGHRVEFGGARTFPYKFLLRHYPIRSQDHGERKIFQDRKPRVLPAAHQRGWHTHYDRYTLGDSFVADPEEVQPYDDEFFTRWFVERLSGVGIERLTPVRPPDS